VIRNLHCRKTNCEPSPRYKTFTCRCTPRLKSYSCPRHDGIWGTGGITSLIFNLDTRWVWLASRFPHLEKLSYPLNNFASNGIWTPDHSFSNQWLFSHRCPCSIFQCCV
jgi:hypothetical protein